MSVVEPGSAGAGLIARVKDILLKPDETWDVIDNERPTIGSLYTGYVLLLAAIPAVCGLIASLVFVGGLLGPVWAISMAILNYILGLAMVAVLALIIEALAPNFGGTKDRIQAFKVAAYAPTASWIAGVFLLIPLLGVLGLLAGAAYSLFLLYKGLPKLMKAPADKATSYFVVVLVVALVINLAIAGVVGSVTAMGAMGGMGLVGANRTVSVPGAGSVDLGKLQEASKKMEAAAKRMESGEAPPPTDPDALKAYLPASVAGFTRGDVSTSSGGAAGVQGSEAEAEYAKGDSSLRLQVTDLGQAGALAGMASAFNVKSSKETATGYEKMGMVGGRMVQESYDRQAKSGEYSVLVGERFMVQARGNGVSMDELKAAVEAVGLSRLEAAAKAG